MSPTYISSLVIIIIAALQLFKINITNQEELQRILEGLVIGIGGLVVLYRRLKHGGINILGQVKNGEPNHV